MSWNTSGCSTDPAPHLLDRRRWLASAAGAMLASNQLSLAGSVPGESPYKALLDRLGEPPAGPASADNLMTNEDSIASVLDRLAELPAGNAYLGVGPDQNFSMIATTRPSMALVLDYRAKNRNLHLLHKALVERSLDRFAYLKTFWARSPVTDAGTEADPARLAAAFAAAPMKPEVLAESQRDVRRFLESEGFRAEADFADIAKIQARLAGPGPEGRFLALKMYPTIGRLIAMKSRSGRPGHWLADDALYKIVRKLHQADAIGPVVADWAGTLAMPKIAAYLSEIRTKVGCVYVSDVEFFLFRAGAFDRYVANLARLPIADEAVIVRTSTREIDHPERVAGNSSTTIVRSLPAFLEAARAGKIRRWDDLF
jgi:hypothetical protein